MGNHPMDDVQAQCIRCHQADAPLYIMGCSHSFFEDHHVGFCLCGACLVPTAWQHVEIEFDERGTVKGLLQVEETDEAWEVAFRFFRPVSHFPSGIRGTLAKADVV